MIGQSHLLLQACIHSTLYHYSPDDNYNHDHDDDDNNDIQHNDDDDNV